MSTTSAPAFVKKAVGWSIGLSVLMIAAGILAIASPMVAGITINLVVAWLLVFSGCVHLVFGWYTNMRSVESAGGLLWELLLGILYVFIGAYLLMHPSAALGSLTIALALYLSFEAILDFILSFMLRPLPGTGWLILDGTVTLILSVIVWFLWPSGARWIIGVLVGVSMLFSGASRLMLSLAARSVTSKLA